MACKDICPICRDVTLVWNKELRKLACPRYGNGCDFVDRRYGNSMLAAKDDRRGGAAMAWSNVKDFR